MPYLAAGEGAGAGTGFGSAFTGDDDFGVM